MVRLYGNKPYKIALIHGGPGDIGSLKYCAEQLESKIETGIIEPLQSKYSISELICELCMQIRDSISGKAILIGHSWGAWLAALFAEQYPELVDKLILVGCPPLEDKYVDEITNRRLCNLSEKDRHTFNRIKDDITCSEDMLTMQALIEKADNVCLLKNGLPKSTNLDGKMYSQVWSEATKMRHERRLLSAFSNIECKIYLIHGENDPHPITGIVYPLLQQNVDCETYILPKCGHSPFEEKHTNEIFFETVKSIILG